MNRRNVFKVLAGAACAAAIELTGIMPRVPKSLNPAWITARWEGIVDFVPLKALGGRIQWHLPGQPGWLRDGQHAGQVVTTGERYVRGKDCWVHVPKYEGDVGRNLPLSDPMGYIMNENQVAVIAPSVSAPAPVYPPCPTHAEFFTGVDTEDDSAEAIMGRFTHFKNNGYPKI